MKQKILLSISILLFIILSNISIQLISQPNDIALYFGLFTLVLSFALLYYPITKTINFIKKNLNN